MIFQPPTIFYQIILYNNKSKHNPFANPHSATMLNNRSISVNNSNIIRYPQQQLSLQLSNHSIDLCFKTQKETYDKINITSQFRQTMQMKRYKYHAKPISLQNYYQNGLGGNLPKSEMISPNRQYTKMLPSTSSNWINNSKKVQTRWLSSKKTSRLKPEKLLQCDNQIIANDIKEYFYSMKQYLNNHKKKVEKQRKIRAGNKQQATRQFQEKNNLSIVRLQPYIQDKVKHPPKEISVCQQTSHRLTQQLSQVQIDNETRSHSRETNFQCKSQTADQMRKIQTNTSHLFRKIAPKQEQYHYIFGKFKQNMNNQDIQKLRILYYRDFLWKICFNRGFIYETPHQSYRYYVGRGNNSRLIRRIMSRRGCWVQESKQENAHFVWTQLKVYEVYKGQKIFMHTTNQKDNMLLTNTENSQKKQQKLQQSEIKIERSYMRGDKNGFVLNKSNYEKWRSYIKSKGGVQRRPKQSMKHRSINPSLQIKQQTHKITNHLQFSRVIGNKKALYRTMSAYFTYKQIQSYLPLTFHITQGLEDQEYLTFLREFYKKSKQGLNCWIVKPGELSNRGKDIKYCKNLKQIKQTIKQKKTNTNGSLRTYIVQLYIQRPFLYQNRKFDLRHYLMITSTQGKIRGYFYQQGYVRTTSYPYSLDNEQPGVHLTNDAIQKYLPQYGKFQKANKLSYQQLHQYMIKINPKKGFYDLILPQLRKIGTEIIHAAFPFIDPQRRMNNFQIFGIDVMIDSQYQCWLIQVNTNPCIEVNCSVLANVIPQMLQNALEIGLDANVCPTQGKIKLNSNNYVESNKFQLVFDEELEGKDILDEYRERNIQIGCFGDDDDNYQSCEEEDYES